MGYAICTQVHIYVDDDWFPCVGRQDADVRWQLFSTQPSVFNVTQSTNHTVLESKRLQPVVIITNERR